MCNESGKKREKDRKGGVGGEEYIKVPPSANNKYQTTGEDVKRRSNFWCACVSAKEIKVEQSGGGKEEGKLECGAKPGEGKVTSGKVDDGKKKDEVSTVWRRSSLHHLSKPFVMHPFHYLKVADFQYWLCFQMLGLVFT